MADRPIWSIALLVLAVLLGSLQFISGIARLGPPIGAFALLLLAGSLICWGAGTRASAPAGPTRALVGALGMAGLVLMQLRPVLEGTLGSVATDSPMLSWLFNYVLLGHWLRTVGLVSVGIAVLTLWAAPTKRSMSAYLTLAPFGLIALGLSATGPRYTQEAGFIEPVAVALVAVLALFGLVALTRIVSRSISQSRARREKERLNDAPDDRRRAGPNPLAVLALIFAILEGGALPVVLGHVALHQISRMNERGRGLALAGLVLGYTSLAGALSLIAIYVALSSGS